MKKRVEAGPNNFPKGGSEGDLEKPCRSLQSDAGTMIQGGVSQRDGEISEHGKAKSIG